MHLVIVSGLSGSGKSTALHVLEDVGYNCIDNLPVSLLPALVAQMQIHKNGDDLKFAIGIDVRNAWQDLNVFPTLIKTLKDAHLPFHVLFLDTQAPVLIQRFSETRRKHPLSDKHTNLKEAIAAEQTLLEPIRDTADQVLDTSHLNLHELRDLVKQRVVGRDTSTMAILFESFGFKHGSPVNADLVFDARCLPNPHWKPELRPQTGKDPAVIEFLEQEETVHQMYSDVAGFLDRWLPHYSANNRSYITIALGCTGGQHRSVYLAEKLYQHVAATHDNVQVRHRDINRQKTH
ncbi:RNase adapter RapZ [Marinimicrobium alkaliphilum]|uniref:RNase adapter RapZ n=1 Tax=Marinimicrobium alkaliphilum TaxID=2202654 RepID=UPI000DB91D15|nr:RNase adapter RapZ [Marinimicrobium alkaliphilum]